MFRSTWPPPPLVPPRRPMPHNWSYAAQARELSDMMVGRARSSKRRAGGPAAQEPSAKRARVEKPAPNLVKPSPIVTVHVRKDEESEYTSFSVHSNYICHYSPFFHAAFNGNFQEAEKKEMHLEETDPNVFGIFSNWLYSQKINNEKGEVPDCAALIDLWIFGDKYLMPRLQNQALMALDEARTKAKKLSSSLYKAIYDGTNAQSHLRSYLIDYCVNSTVDISCPESYPTQLLVDIINTTRAERRGLDKATRRWEMLPEDMEDYFVDENVDIGTEQRHGMSHGINLANAADQPTTSGADANSIPNPLNNQGVRTTVAGSSETAPGDRSFAYVDLDSDDSLNPDGRSSFQVTDLSLVEG